MATYNNLPIFEMILASDDDGLEYISLVDRPAISIDFVKFSESKPEKKFFAVEDKQMLVGPAMRANYPIYRVNEKTKEEYYVMFSPESIFSIVKHFNKNKKNTGINLMHQDNSEVDATIVEQWFVDGENDKSKKYGFDLTDGDWMIAVYIEDKALWDSEIKTGNIKGFSIEGFLSMATKKTKKEDMKEIKLTEVQVATGKIFVNGEIAVGTMVYCSEPTRILIDGKDSIIQYPYWNTTVELTDGNVLSLVDGKIVAITKKENTNMSQKLKFEAQAKTKDGVVIYTPTELVKDAEVYNVSETGDQTPVADDDYILENGTTITVKAGKITAVVEAAPESTPAKPVAAEETVAHKLVEKIDAILARLSKLEESNVQMSEKFAKIPGGPSITEKDDTKIDVKSKTTFADSVMLAREITKNLKK